MSLKSKIEAVIYASEEPVTLAQLASVLGEEARAELEASAAVQDNLPLEGEESPADELDSADETAAEEPATPEEAAAEEEAALEETAGVGDQHAGDGHVAPEADGGAESPAEAEESVDTEALKKKEREAERAVREYLRGQVDKLIQEYAESDRGIEVREVAGGYRMGTKPEYHDAVRGFVKSLRPPLKLSLQALETLAVVAYKQPVTAAEIGEIRGVDSGGVLGGLMTRKLIQTAGRKQVVGRPMLYKTTKEFLVRFGLKDINELPSIEEFEKMAGELSDQDDLPMEAGEVADVIEDANARGDAEMIRGELAVEAQPDGDGHSADEAEQQANDDTAAEAEETSSEGEDVPEETASADETSEAVEEEPSVEPAEEAASEEEHKHEAES